MTTQTPVWMARASKDPRLIFSTPDDLWLACCEYFQWIENNPLMATETVKFQGVGGTMEVPKMRAMTISGMCLFLGVTRATWTSYRGAPDYLDICDAVEGIIYQQKLTGAAADLLNQSIISRELGLKDKQEREITGKDGAPIAAALFDKADYAAARAAMLKDDDC